MSVEDFKYLSEFAETFSGLSSVKKLAIRIEFIHLEEEKKTWWGTLEEENGTYKGGNRKTESVMNFLQSTNQLDALEIFIDPSNVREGDHSQVLLDCLSALPRSRNSLRHLRLLGGITVQESHSLWNAGFFQVLRVLTMDANAMIAFSHFDLPQSIEILHLPYYFIGQAESAPEDEEEEFQEYKLIRDMIDHKCQPRFDCLKEVVLPSSLIGFDGERIVSPQWTQLWAQSRRELERSNVIQTGKVKLRTVEVGENGE